MRARPLFLLVTALGCGLLASIGVSQVMDGQHAVAGRSERILVATTDIDYGDPLTEDNTRLEAWPSAKVPLHALKSLAEVEYPAACRLVAGIPITSAMLKPVAGPATTIPPGYRVVTARVSLDAAAGNLLKPGDRVDLIAFFRRSQEIPQTATRKILRNVRVFAVNADTERVDEGQTVVKTVGFLVKEEQVERTMLAIRLGEMSVALRRPDEPEEGSDNTSMATVASLLNGAPGLADEDSPVAIAPSFTPQVVPSARRGQAAGTDDEQRVAIISTSGEMVMLGPDEAAQLERRSDPRRTNGTPSQITPAALEDVLRARQGAGKRTPSGLQQMTITPDQLRLLLGADRDSR